MTRYPYLQWDGYFFVISVTSDTYFSYILAHNFEKTQEQEDCKQVYLPTLKMLLDRSRGP